MYIAKVMTTVRRSPHNGESTQSCQPAASTQTMPGKFLRLFMSFALPGQYNGDLGEEAARCACARVAIDPKLYNGFRI